MTIHLKRRDSARIRARFFGLAVTIVMGLSLPHLAQAQYVQQAKLIGAGGFGAPQQGTSVALSGDGSTLIVGGPFANLSGPSGFVGSAWVFKRQRRSWTQEAILIGAIASPFEQTQQGFSVALSRDGNTAIVGAPGDFFVRGDARVFTRTDGRWTEQAILFTPDGHLSFQGRSVALSADGNIAIVGGYNDASGVGAAWVFARSGNVWTQQAKLLASDAVGGAHQGWSVALSGDGRTALVGAPSDNGGVGAAWIFYRAAGQWIQGGPKLVGADASGAARQGYSVALSRPGHVALVGGPSDNGGVGASWLFQRRRGVWRQEGTKLVGSEAVGAAQQGASVSLSRAGVTALVGGPGDNNSMGAAWSFTRWANAWRQQGPKLVGGQAIGNAAQGNSVSLSGSGNIALVGGPFDNGGIGAAWVYYRSFQGTPQVASCYTQSVTALTDRFGGINTAAWSLGYGMGNVAPLQSAIHAYCSDGAQPASGRAG